MGKREIMKTKTPKNAGFHGDDMIGKQVGAERVYDFTEKEDESMTGRSRIRTDLALEATERFQEENVEVHGVEIQEKYDAEKDVRTTVVRITTENGARTMGKPQGTYITIEAPDLSVPDEDYHREISEEVAHHLRELIDLGTAAVSSGGWTREPGDHCGFSWTTCGFRSSYDKACDPGVWTEVKCTYENASDQRNRTRSDGSDRNGNAGDRSGGRFRNKAGCGDRH